VTLFAQRKTTCKNELAEGYGKGKESLFVGYKKEMENKVIGTESRRNQI
jgi:hypothetical protein